MLLLLEGESGWLPFVLVVAGCLIVVIVLSKLAERALKNQRRGKRKGRRGR